MGGESPIPHPPEAWALFLGHYLKEASDPALECPSPRYPKT